MKTYHGAKDGWLEEAVKTRPFGRLIDPKEVARACAYLCSDESGLMTGVEHRLRPERRRRGRPADRALSDGAAHGARSPPRRHHHRPLVGRPLRRAGRRAPRGHGELRQGGRRLPDQHRHRHGAARPEERPHHPRRRRAHGPLHPRAMRARGRRRRRRPHRSGRGSPRSCCSASATKRPSRSSSIATIAPTARSTRATSTRPTSTAPRRSLVSGTHFARANTAAAQRKAMRIARAAGRKVVFDIDYRPNLWGLAGHGAGEERYIKSDERHGAVCSAILPHAISSSAPRRR